MTTPDAIALFRRKRLDAFVKEKHGGDKTSAGQALGYKNGAYIGQMSRGDRAISEKTVMAIEALPGCHGWFSTAGTSLAQPLALKQLVQLSREDAAQVFERIGEWLSNFDEPVREAAAALLKGVAMKPADAHSLGEKFSALISEDAASVKRPAQERARRQV